jgi:hypothetical protein
MLDAGDIEALAEALAPRVADLVRAENPPFPMRGLVTTKQVTELLQVERYWVYEHKAELGAVRLGDDGERGPLRFEASRVLAYVKSKRIAKATEQEARRPGRPRRRRHEGFDLVPIPGGA